MDARTTVEPQSESTPASELHDLTVEVAAATRLREGPEGVEAVLRAIFLEEPVGLKPLARKLRLPVPVLAAVRGELEKRLLLHPGSGIAYTEEGRKRVQAMLGIHTREHFLCNACKGRAIQIPGRLRFIAEKLAQYAAQAPGADTRLDQTPSTPESALRRVLFMYEQGALENRRLLILGDDDSISLAAGLLGKAISPGGALAARITVLERDPRWLAHLDSVARQEGLSLDLIEADLRDPLPEALRSAYDVFETDPPYTLAGMSLFVSRGVEALEAGAGRQGFLSLGARSPGEMLEFQQALTGMGLVIAQMLPNFNVYQGASILGGTSHLFHLWTTAASRPAFAGPYREETIYTGGQNPTVRRYRCLNCGQETWVGAAQPFEVVEDLIRAGCPHCGENRFELLGRTSSQPPGQEAG